MNEDEPLRCGFAKSAELPSLTTRTGIPQMTKELEIDGEPFMTYTSNVYIIRKNHDTDPNLFNET